MGKIQLAAIFCAALLNCSPAVTSNSELEPEGGVIGEIAAPCRGCPDFVRVPDGPSSIRRVVSVAKYPLTWAKYLRSFDEGACSIPARALEIEPRLLVSETLVDELRIDWPIGILNESEINCYATWLQSKTNLTVAVPTETEWDWLAAGELSGANFPWGDETDNPPAAVAGVEVASRDEIQISTIQNANLLFTGVRVGLFPPNTWGLHDLIGNQYELTSTVYGQDEWLERYPNAPYFDNDSGIRVAIIKGGDRYSENWRRGINGKPISVRIINGQYSASVSVRFVLIAGDSD